MQEINSWYWTIVKETKECTSSKKWKSSRSKRCWRVKDKQSRKDTNGIKEHHLKTGVERKEMTLTFRQSKLCLEMSWLLTCVLWYFLGSCFSKDGGCISCSAVNWWERNDIVQQWNIDPVYRLATIIQLWIGHPTKAYVFLLKIDSVHNIIDIYWSI